MTNNIDAAVIGGTGYTGGETLRLLIDHPNVSVIETTSRSSPGTPVAEQHPNLNGRTDLRFQKEELGRLNEEADVLFFALPHGVSMQKIAELDLNETVAIDLGADFRLDDPETYREAYDQEHVAPDLLDQATYGLTEHNRDEISHSNLIACPGCFPTGALLAILPLLQQEKVESDIIVDSKTGSSGSGKSPSSATHHPERATDFRAYKLFNHRHAEEMKQEGAKRLNKDVHVTFTPHSAPMIRGIFTTAYLTLTESFDEVTLEDLYEETYANCPFVRIVDQPRSTVVAGTNYCDLSVQSNGKNVIVLSAIDNLLKGAAGQAVQNMNEKFGFPETAGLTFPGTHP